ncbi:uncharacterized protein LAESUDRAFT_710091 [Laetiporus sulphureus 93-53]|uniref:Uncharacterized protein n=1 Tax=Laetiporus sulphureus 93-53 TaxID=1314785 RepID=A0A165IEN2_9APHY|nr:uncharacterized protein LAESUDRAFT_710091 [Laetiporus sulphureus 93-53]KZT12970.1 hypothetical protein LAESUDRAFT_710091 [Laetiporus sulphureus 93-53]
MSCRLQLHMWRRASAPRSRSHFTAQSRPYSTSGGASDHPGPSRHAQFYSDLVPGMIPVALLGSAVYLGLRLLRASLSHEKYLDEARERVRQLEEEVETLQRAQQAKEGAEIAGKSSERSLLRWGR